MGLWIFVILLSIDLVIWFFYYIAIFPIARELSLLLLFLLFEEGSLVRRNRTIKVTCTLFIIISAVGFTLFSLLLVRFNASTLLMLTTLFAGIVLFSRQYSMWQRISLGYLSVTSFGMVFLIASAVLLQENPNFEMDFEKDASVVLHIPNTSQKYRFIFDRFGKNICLSTSPFVREQQIISLEEPSRPIVKGPEFALVRHVYPSDANIVLALDWNNGPVVLDRGSFRILDQRAIPKPERDDIYRYIGIAWKAQTQTIFIARADGMLFELHYPDLNVVRQSGRIAEMSLVFSEAVHDICYFENSDTLVVNTFIGYLIAYKPALDQVGERCFLFGPSSNLVPVDEGRFFYVSKMFQGALYKVRTKDLKILEKQRIATGIRYINAVPKTDYLLVSNYFTGEIVLYETSTKRKIASVIAGPRIQWLETIPNSRRFCVSHAAGLTVFDLDKMITGGLKTDRIFRFPYFVWSPGFFLPHWDRLFVKDYIKLLSVVLILLCIVKYRESQISAMPPTS